MTQDLIERIARVHYEKYMEGVGDVELPWDKLPDDHKSRMMLGIEASLTALSKSHYIVPREATADMCGALWNCLSIRSQFIDCTPSGAYRAMCEAAPKVRT